MKHLVLVSHANLAFAFKDAVKMIAGENSVDNINCICMYEGRNQDDFVQEATELLKKDPTGEYLIFADLYGASPANSCIMTFGNNKAKYRIVTGMSLGMILEVLFILENMSLDELADKAIHASVDGAKTIHLVRN